MFPKRVFCVVVLSVLVFSFSTSASNIHPVESSPARALDILNYPAFSDSIIEGSEFVPGEILVKFKQVVSGQGLNLQSPSDIDSVRDLNTQFEVTEIELILPNLYHLSFPEEIDVPSVVRAYETNPNVEYAEPNYVLQVSAVPNDLGYPYQWAHKVMQSEQAWNIEKGDPNVVIAIIDTGVDWNHPDLAANIWNNTDEIIDGVDNDGNGYVDDVRGYDFVDTTVPVYPGEDGKQRDNDPMDFHGHGTHCAGIAAAVTNNGDGVAGMSWNCKIMPVRAAYTTTSGHGRFETDDTVLAIRYAADNDAAVISMSFTFDFVESLREACDYAYTEACVLVAAAGNDNFHQRQYPAAFDNVIAVGATDQSDSKASFSNYGSWIDVSAPGVDILSTLFDDTYDAWQGTSMSTPFVAGLAALILSRNPNFTNEEVRNVIRSTTDPVYSTEYIGVGRINAYKALQRDMISIASLSSSFDDGTIRGLIGINGTATGKNFTSYQLHYGLGVYPKAWTQIGSTVTSPVLNSVLATWDTSKVPDGVYTIRLQVYDVSRKVSEDRAVMWISQSPFPGYYETSEYMIGSVAVGIIFLESNGKIDPKTETWASTEESQVVSEIETGLDWWADQNPSANLSFSYDIHYKVPTSYEPINRPFILDGIVIISQVMASLGYTRSILTLDDILNQIRDYVNNLRKTLDTDWAFAIFVADSSADADGLFADGVPAASWLGGPFCVMTYDNARAPWVEWSNGRIFWATNENNGTPEWSGYLNEQDNEGSGCLMDNHSPRLSAGTKLQVGWRDSDGDGIMDIIDTLPDVALKPYSPDPTTNRTLGYTGTASVVPYPNQNPTKFGRAVTVTTVKGVQFRIDSGSWTDANATDGSFDDPVEDFTFRTPELPYGNHTIQVRAVNSVGNMGYGEDTVTVTRPPAPDLIIRNISWTPETPASEATVTFTVTIKNNGTANAASFKTAYYINATKLGEWSITSLSVGQELNKTFTWVCVEGSHTVKAFADSGNTVNEQVETDNELEKAFQVAPKPKPDLIISSISWVPEIPVEGNTVTFTVTIKNNGTANAASFKTAYYINATKLGEWSITSLSVGQELNKTFTWTYVEGSHTIKVITDSNGEIQEDDETNNEREEIIGNLPPMASFSCNGCNYLSNPIAYLRKSTIFNATESYDPDGSIISYCWDFGDGNVTTVTDAITSHNYTHTGNYKVTLNITDNLGMLQTASGNVTVKLQCDVNNDGIVNVLDVSLVSIAYKSKPGDQNWNPNVDFDNDQSITILDVTFVARDYGEKA